MNAVAQRVVSLLVRESFALRRGESKPALAKCLLCSRSYPITDERCSCGLKRYVPSREQALGILPEPKPVPEPHVFTALELQAAVEQGRKQQAERDMWGRYYGELRGARRRSRL